MCDFCSTPGMNRRAMMLAGAGMLAAAPLGYMAGDTAQAQPAAARPATPDAALKALMEGNARYAANQPRERDFSAGRAARAQSQAPFAAILSCADSRLAPEFTFDQSPGDLFVVRVAGNFVTPDGLGSLEYGAAVLGTKVIMVLGHTNCGAVNATVQALQKGNTLPGHIADLVRAMKPGIDPVLKQPGPDLAQRALAANVRYNVEQLKQSKPILAEMVAKKELSVVGGIYDIATGKINLV
jgi:carbonic anhydrase